MTPSCNPSTKPTIYPSCDPSVTPSTKPSKTPVFNPTKLPTVHPSTDPSKNPSIKPSESPHLPTGQPTGQPSDQPTGAPSGQPSSEPTSSPTNLIENPEIFLVGNSTKDIISAVKSGSLAAVEQVINALGPDNMVQSNYAYTSLIFSIFNNHDEVANTIIKRTKLSIDAQGRLGNTALHWAAYVGNVISSRNLLIQGADFTILNKDGETPLILANKKGHRNVAEILREFGAKS